MKTKTTKHTHGPLESGAWAMIRNNGTNNYIDLATLSFTAEACQAKALDTDKQIPHWAKDNKAIYASRIRITTQQAIARAEGNGEG